METLPDAGVEAGLVWIDGGIRMAWHMAMGAHQTEFNHVARTL